MQVAIKWIGNGMVPEKCLFNWVAGRRLVTLPDAVANVRLSGDDLGGRRFPETWTLCENTGSANRANDTIPGGYSCR